MSEVEGELYRLLLDKTLSVAGAAADAGAVGEEMKKILELIADKMQLTPEFANDISECTDRSKLYVLPDGYIYAYMKEKTIVSAPELYDKSTVTLGYRYSGTPGTLVVSATYFITDYIPIDMSTDTSILKIVANVKINQVGGDVPTYQKIAFFDSNKNILGSEYIHSAYSSVTQDELETTINVGYLGTINGGKVDYYDKIAYVRIEVVPTGHTTTMSDADVIQSIKNTSAAKEETVTAWLSTGRAFIPVDYEERIIAMEQIDIEQNENIAECEERIADLENGVLDMAVTIPSYWKSTVKTAIEKVKVIQDISGKDVINFMWFSDLHYYKNADGYVGNIGKLCRYVMDKCNIPFALMSGDTLTASSLTTETDVLDTLEQAMEVLSPIGEDLLLVRGNHDDVYGSYTDGDATRYYTNKVASAKIWNRLHRIQAKDDRRVFGDDGTYFYIDLQVQKVRIICLNSQFYDGGDVTSGTTGNMTNGFGEAQLNWLENVALAVDEDWSVIVTEHIPPTASVINGNTYYLSQISDGVEFRKIIATTTANIIAIFCGHCHADAYVTDDLKCPIVTITSAINTPYDADWSTRVANSATETVMDVVSIDKATRKIYMTRIGAGADRAGDY